MVQKRVTVFDITLVVLLVLMSCAFIYPLLNMVALSFSDSTVLKSQPVYLVPRGFSLRVLQRLLSDNRILVPLEHHQMQLRAQSLAADHLADGLSALVALRGRSLYLCC